MLKKELLEILEEQKSRVSEEIYNKLKVLINSGILENQFILNVCIAKDQLIHNLENEYNNILVAEAVEGTQEAPTEEIKTFVPLFNYSDPVEAIEEQKDPIDQEQKDPTDPTDQINKLKEEIRQEAQQQKENINNMAEAVKPEKGNIKNENYDLPINTHPDNMTNKNIDYDLIGALTLKSNFGGTFINHNGERYFYKNDLNYSKLAEVIGKSEATVKRLFNKLLKSDTNIITVGNSKNGIFYTLNCKTDNKYYVLINHKQLYQMLTNFKPDMIKLYITLKLKCNYEINVNGHKGAVKLSNEYIGAKMGYKVNNGTISGTTKTKIASMTNTLETMGYITKTLKYETMWDDVQKREITKKRNYYTICTYEEWALKNPKEAQ